ncbi:purine-binding chemotaxis protein CheW [Chitinimonas arctica]|uniref:Purine-binding chemotaxis protein CheW n=1 Tax=Chitinimonas arctica TaxID=2594795 RepID=A0A516SEJ0_9NEIS|nr:chemotaxis protein CheW [Chitinimonas arctica]QDQ26575.1 purine-binding chemotaxis protein CheW [Chitinimonas arctica]
MSDSRQLLVFRLDARRIALDLAVVERVIRAVAITPLPAAPEGVCGVIQLHGKVVPIFDIRQRFGLPGRTLRLSDQIVIARTDRPVGLCVDEIEAVAAYPVERIVAADSVLEGLAHVQGVVSLDDGLLLVHDLAGFLSLEEARQLGSALAQLPAA